MSLELYSGCLGCHRACFGSLNSLPKIAHIELEALRRGPIHVDHRTLGSALLGQVDFRCARGSVDLGYRQLGRNANGVLKGGIGRNDRAVGTRQANPDALDLPDHSELIPDEFPGRRRVLMGWTPLSGLGVPKWRC